MKKNKKKANLVLVKNYVLGLDGGGAKTTALLADLTGKIIAQAKTGSSHPRNLGLSRAIDSVALVIEQVLKNLGKEDKVGVSFLGLPTIAEEFKLKKKVIKKELLKHKEISLIFKGRVIIDSDQRIGFFSGTDEKDGLVLIAGSGSVCHGWNKGKEIKIDGWGYLSEMGSAFFVGQKTLQEVFKGLDGRSQQTLLTRLIFCGLKVKNKEELISLLYAQKPTEIIPFLAIYCNLAAEKGDKLARKILITAAQKLAFSAKLAIKKLQFTQRKFPLVLVGSMFNSQVFTKAVKKEIKQFAGQVEFIRPKKEPAFGAVKLALREAAKLKIH